MPYNVLSQMQAHNDSQSITNAQMAPIKHLISIPSVQNLTGL